MFVDRSDQNAPNQAMIMAREINQAKRKYLEDNGQRDTPQSTSPSISYSPV